MSSIPSASVPGPDPLDLPFKSALVHVTNGLSPASMGMALFDWLVHLATSPSRQAQLASSAFQKGLAYAAYLQACTRGAAGECVAPAAADRRFSRPEWQAQPYQAMAQAFLLTQQWWAEAGENVRGVSKHHEHLASYLVRQWLDLLSPSNLPLLNPQVLRETVGTSGANLARGFQNWARDAVAVGAGGKPRGVEAFRPGETVALTPGKVVHRNALAELIQYEPTTAKVRKEPVLVVPSWIMKFYILDLTPQESLVKYLVDQGHTVFMVSWRNPGSEDRDVALDDYLDAGVLDMVAAVQRTCPDSGIHAAGYCLGGTLLAMGAAVLGGHRQHPLRTVTLLAGQVDFEEPGELGLFIDESQIALLEDLMAPTGYLDGPRMAGAFQLLNTRDLVWSRLLHEYLMGAQTPMTAMRAWNADATRMPARMHSEYLRKLYMENELAEGNYRFRGDAISLRRIQVPVFVVGTERDHVSPWHSVFKVLRKVQAPTRFVLASGGHNVGIVSPPAGPGAHDAAGYRWADHAANAAPSDPQAWLAQAQQAQGSWWPAWSDWLRGHGSRDVAARPVRAVKFEGKVVRAPGAFVHQQ